MTKLSIPSLIRNRRSFLVLPMVILILSSSGFASVKACGTIQLDHGTLIFTQEIKGQNEDPSPVYASTKLSIVRQKEVNAQLAAYVGFREVCVMVSTNEANEGDTVVTRVVSANE